jgi:hypothetical protein
LKPLSEGFSITARSVSDGVAQVNVPAPNPSLMLRAAISWRILAQRQLHSKTVFGLLNYFLCFLKNEEKKIEIP